MATQTTGGAQATMATAVAVVNGPEDDLFDWDAVDWRACEQIVRRLRQRIFTASQAGDLKRVRSLQKLMLRSRANTLLSVRRVTELNAGRKTAGVDGKVVLLSSVKAELADWVQRHTGPWQVHPVKRVYIPKKGSMGTDVPHICSVISRHLPGHPSASSKARRERASSSPRRSRIRRAWSGVRLRVTVLPATVRVQCR